MKWPRISEADVLVAEAAVIIAAAIWLVLRFF